MTRRGMGLVAILILVLFVGLVYSQVHTPRVTKARAHQETKLLGKSPVENPRLLSKRCVSGLKSPSNEYIVGEIDTCGGTYYDMQANSTVGRLIALDPENNVHVAWMCGYNASLDPRHIQYNFKPYDGDWMWPVWDDPDGLGGVAAEGSFKAGYTTLAVNSLTWPFPAFHQRIGGAPDNYHTGVSADWGFIADPSHEDASRGGLMAAEPPYMYDPTYGVDLKLIWPKIAIDRYDSIHVIGNASTDSAGDVQLPDYLSYWKGNCNDAYFTITFHDGHFIEYNSELLAADIATAPSADKIAIGLIKDLDTTFCNWTNHYNVGYVESDNLGETWSDFIPVTDYGARSANHSELIYWTYDEADAESVFVYTRPTRDCNIYYDSDNNLHMVWTEITFTAANTGNPCDDSTVYNGTLLMHWCEETGNITSIFGDHPISGSNFGTSMPSNVYRSWPVAFAPIMSEGPDGKLYVVYQRYSWDFFGGFFTEFGDSLYYPEYDQAESDVPNKDIYVVMSDDDGLSWGPEFNITNSHTPYGAPDSCDDETDPSLALKVDDYLHILYTLDKDAGPIVVDMGTVTYNPMIYHKVPTSLIPGPDDCYIKMVYNFGGQYFPRIYSSTPPDTADIMLVRWYLHCEEAYQVRLLFSPDNGETFYHQNVGIADSIIGFWWQMPRLEEDSVQAKLLVQAERADGTILGADTSGSFVLYALGDARALFSFSKAGVVFDSIEIGEYDTTELGLVNAGSGPVEVLNVWIEETEPFSILGATAHYLDGGDEAIIHIVFHPTDPLHLGTIQRIYAAIQEGSEIDTVFIPVQCGATYIKENNINLPKEFTLKPNYPNPFNATTTFSFTVDKVSQVDLTIYNIRGEVVKKLVDSMLSPGYYRATWDGRDDYGNPVASGVYLTKISNGFGKIITNKMTLLK
ncbi:T9SS type A sorting domain-containing protein [bacterium]|nr:T9SS type A sorting domain-containing protein [bacterium]